MNKYLAAGEKVNLSSVPKVRRRRQRRPCSLSFSRGSHNIRPDPTSHLPRLLPCHPASPCSSWIMPKALHLCHLPSLALSTDKSHHLANSAGFCNPWPSFGQRGTGPLTILKARYGPGRPAFIPVPEDRSELVQVRKPDLTPPTPGKDGEARMKVTWIGHASFLVQCSPPATSDRGINILLDPVFSERTSPLSFIGPKRYTPPPCTLEELCDSVPIDVVCISHNHYDHADTATLGYLFERAKNEGRDVICCTALGNGRWMAPLIPDRTGRERVSVWSGDWWDRIEIGLGENSDASRKHSEQSSTEQSTEVSQDDQMNGTSVPQSAEHSNISSRLRITVTPSQHASARSPFDKDRDLWCSFALELPPYSDPGSPSSGISASHAAATSRGSNVFFSGDTAYRSTFPSPQDPADHNVDALSPSARESYPSCPAFAQIGEQLGPFTLALLPIGLTKPRSFMSNVHADSRDSICMHRDVKSKRSVGMHWGTVRGGISGQYEDVRSPPREWESAAGEAGLKWRRNYIDGRSTRPGKGGDVDDQSSVEGEAVDQEGATDDWEIGLMDIGESLTV